MPPVGMITPSLRSILAISQYAFLPKPRCPSRCKSRTVDSLRVLVAWSRRLYPSVFTASCLLLSMSREECSFKQWY